MAILGNFFDLASENLVLDAAAELAAAPDAINFLFAGMGRYSRLLSVVRSTRRLTPGSSLSGDPCGQTRAVRSLVISDHLICLGADERESQRLVNVTSGSTRE